MKLTWLGHSGFRIEIADQVLLVDPWLSGNPMFPEERRDEAVRGATAILVSHGHADHAADAPGLARDLKIPVAGTYDLVGWWAKTHGIEATGFNKGGTICLGAVGVTLVNATHSSSVATENGPVYGGAEAGFMIEGEGRTIYFSGDTDVTADMEIFQALHRPQIGLLAAGGHFTMDMARAAWAAKRFFDFETVIPCHYLTFPLLEQSAEKLAEALPGVRVIEPEVLTPIDL
jgi:L-ascorbate metabolism protein UlaG (beta-lactamase superfamily)